MADEKEKSVPATSGTEMDQPDTSVASKSCESLTSVGSQSSDTPACSSTSSSTTTSGYSSAVQSQSRIQSPSPGPSHPIPIQQHSTVRRLLMQECGSPGPSGSPGSSNSGNFHASTRHRSSPAIVIPERPSSTSSTISNSSFSMEPGTSSSHSTNCPIPTIFGPQAAHPLTLSPHSTAGSSRSGHSRAGSPRPLDTGGESLTSSRRRRIAVFRNNFGATDLSQVDDEPLDPTDDLSGSRSPRSPISSRRNSLSSPLHCSTGHPAGLPGALSPAHSGSFSPIAMSPVHHHALSHLLSTRDRVELLRSQAASPTASAMPGGSTSPGLLGQSPVHAHQFHPLVLSGALNSSTAGGPHLPGPTTSSLGTSAYTSSHSCPPLPPHSFSASTSTSSANSFIQPPASPIPNHSPMPHPAVLAPFGWQKSTLRNVIHYDMESFCFCHRERNNASHCSCGEMDVFPPSSTAATEPGSGDAPSTSSQPSDSSTRPTLVQPSLEWMWDKDRKSRRSVIVSNEGRDVSFHAEYSTGTGCISGSEPFVNGHQYFWEIKMTSLIYGTDVMIGLGTKHVNLDKNETSFKSMLGEDAESWGVSYTGLFHHAGQNITYGPRFGQGSIMGLHLDTWRGTLSLYRNRVPIGIISRSPELTCPPHAPLWPMASSTAARTSMRLIRAQSYPTSLQWLACCALRTQIAPQNVHVLDHVSVPPGLQTHLRKRVNWILAPTESLAPPLPLIPPPPHHTPHHPPSFHSHRATTPPMAISGGSPGPASGNLGRVTPPSTPPLRHHPSFIPEGKRKYYNQIYPTLQIHRNGVPVSVTSYTSLYSPAASSSSSASTNLEVFASSSVSSSGSSRTHSSCQPSTASSSSSECTSAGSDNSCDPVCSAGGAGSGSGNNPQGKPDSPGPPPAKRVNLSSESSRSKRSTPSTTKTTTSASSQSSDHN